MNKQGIISIYFETNDTCRLTKLKSDTVFTYLYANKILLSKEPIYNIKVPLRVSIDEGYKNCLKSNTLIEKKNGKYKKLYFTD